MMPDSTSFTDQNVIDYCWRYGHFRNPFHIQGWNVALADLTLLTINHQVVREAILSVQQFLNPNYQEIAHQQKGRSRLADLDGIAGLLTRELMELPRCGLPDYQEEGTQDANWPVSCRENLRWGGHLNLGFSQNKTVALIDEAHANWNNVIDVFLQLTSFTDPNKLDIYAKMANLGGSILANSELARNRCDVTLKQNYDRRSWGETLFITTQTHENGHALGFNHVSDKKAVMYSIIGDSQQRRGKPNDTDLRQATRLSYNLRTSPPVPPDDPDPDPDPDTPISDERIILLINKVIGGDPNRFRGMVGLRGTRGLPGEIGLKGVRGIRGEMGVQGIQGIQGNIGPRGPAGKGRSGSGLSQQDKRTMRELISTVHSYLELENNPNKNWFGVERDHHVLPTRRKDIQTLLQYLNNLFLE